MISNRIVTRGLSSTSKNLLVTRGFIPGIVQAVLEFFRRIPHGRRPKYAERWQCYEEFTVRASLIAINDDELVDPISGRVKIIYDDCQPLSVKARNKVVAKFISLWDAIVIKARLKRKR